MEDEKDLLKTKLEIAISDMIFNQHMNSQTFMNIILISTQFIALSASIISTICGVNIGKYTAIYSLVICILVVLNNYVHESAWKKAKEAQKNKIDKMIDIMFSDDTDMEKLYNVNQLLGAKVLYDRPDFWDFVVNAEDDVELNKLKFNWIRNARRSIPTGVNDANGVEYCTGDIVYNSAFGDYWLVEEVDNETMKEYGADIPFIFSLYGNPDEYAMCIDEPEGFTIEARVNDFSYTNMLSRFVRIYKQHREEEAECEREAREGDKINEQTNSEETNEQEIND